MNTHVKPPKAGEVAEAAPDIHARMVAVMRDLGAIGKDKKNEAQGFKYRGIDDVYNAINPILAEHGVFMTAEVLSKSREERVAIKEYQGNKKESILAFTCLKMRYHFRAEDGSSVSTEAEGEGMDSGDKSSNKAMAVAHKYALLQAFCIPTQDMVDPDAEVHEVSAPARKTQAQVIHQGMAQIDPDIEAGVTNWIAKQSAAIAKCERLPDLLMWQDEQEDALHRLLKKHPEGHKKIMAQFNARMTYINNLEKK